MKPLPVLSLADQCAALHEQALELSALLRGLADLPESNPLFWSLARQSERLTEGIDTLQVSLSGQLWPVPCPQKARPPGSEAPGVSVHNPISGESNHDVPQV